MESAPIVNQPVDSEDQLTQTKSIYQVSAGEIFFKNFLAGFGRALGGIFIYAVFIGISAYLFITIALPQIQPFIDEYRQAVQGLSGFNQTTVPITGSDTQQYQQFIKDLNSSLGK